MEKYESPTIEQIGGIEGGNGEGFKTESWFFAWGYVVVDVIAAVAMYFALVIVMPIPLDSDRKQNR